ncbi:MAG TPA: phenylacetate--CoA ligase family protein [Gammaproteobacteria bacterium]|nr:phenylacetate--CoA ligase family protein [Gammaproteobacteria bacterium]
MTEQLVSADYLDDLELRDPEQREQALFAALPEFLVLAARKSPAVATLLQGFDLEAVNSREGLAQLPVVRKSALIGLQAEQPPFGGFASLQSRHVRRVFASPGPIHEPEGDTVNYWRMARALYAAGIRAGELVHNTFSYHFTPAGSMLESAAAALGCPVFAAGTGQTELQIETIERLRPVAYAGTPSFLNILLDRANESGSDLSSFRNALVSGEALPNALRESIEKHGIHVSQCYATADVGLIAYESNAREGLIIDEETIVEIVCPGTGDPVAVGEVGEVVVTTFNPVYPLIRLATGDLSAELPGISSCGRTNRRIRGWMGRADQTAKVRGMFIHPEQVANVVARHAQISKARLVISRVELADRMTLRCETSLQDATSGLGDLIQASVRELCKLRADIELVASGSLANDGKVIDDVRPIDEFSSMDQ